MRDLRDDADGARQASAAERRRDAHRKGRRSNRRRGQSRAARATTRAHECASPLRLTRIPQRAPRPRRSSCRTRPEGAHVSAVAARRGIPPARAPIDQVAWMATAQRIPLGTKVFGNQPVDQRGRRQSAFAAAGLENQRECPQTSGFRRRPCTECVAGTPRRRVRSA